jgi:ectoine hydroxylase-related dioxygenase (phytanoyl-CoA dioxygenase family)
MSNLVSNLPEISENYLLTANDLAAFRRDGHILLRGVATPAEIAVYQPAIKAAVDRYNTEQRPVAERDTYGKAFLQIMNLWVRDEAVRRFTLARRFAKIAADLMGVEGVRIYHDQALFKEPGGGFTPWHQDQYYWPVDTDHTVTMWMPLIDVTPEMGIMVFASGSHVAGYIGDLPISDKSEEVIQQFVSEHSYPLSRARAMSAGDATFHTGWTLHCAPGNQTALTREVMTIIYVADGSHALKPDNINRAHDLADWMPGLKPGDRVASPLNPLVYSATKGTSVT